jgi:hypothetical protein
MHSGARLDGSPKSISVVLASSSSICLREELRQVGLVVADPVRRHPARDLARRSPQRDGLAPVKALSEPASVSPPVVPPQVHDSVDLAPRLRPVEHAGAELAPHSGLDDIASVPPGDHVEHRPWVQVVPFCTKMYATPCPGLFTPGTPSLLAPTMAVPPLTDTETPKAS